MTTGGEVTGLDLYELWRVANVHLVEVAALYSEVAAGIHEVDEPDENTYGTVHPWWATLAADLERAVVDTAESLEATCRSLNEAIDEFSHVDGKHGGALTAAGRDLEAVLVDRRADDPDSLEPDGGEPKPLREPHWDPPQEEDR